MHKANVEEVVIRQAMERAWLLMALASSALSDHPLVKSSKRLRECTDRARKALFDLYRELERILDAKGAPSQDDHSAE
jgi:hypothetical protein